MFTLNFDGLSKSLRFARPVFSEFGADGGEEEFGDAGSGVCQIL